MARIRILSDSLANKIAAGEVVERPAAIVKELVENALDAGAGRIAITIEGGGKSLIRVEDDGSGIEPEDLPLAFERHATSKISTAEDLLKIDSMGFRGEALPSIAAVSRLVITSQSEDQDAGTRLAIDGGSESPIELVPFATGTMVEIRDLFFNVPARRKFLKTSAAETAAATAVATRMALVNPEVHFILTVNGNQRFSCPAVASLRARIGQLFGTERGEALLEVTRVDDPGAIEAFAEPPSMAYATRGEQYLFVNRRPIVDRQLQQAVTRAYDGMIPGGRFPGAFVFLTIAPGDVDVNVHPAKSEVRFADPKSVHSLVSRSIRDVLKRSSYAPPLRAGERLAEAGEPFRPGAGSDRPARNYSLSAPSPAPVTGSGGSGREARRTTTARSRWRPPLAGPAPELRVLGQFRSTFLVACDEDGIVLVDQHTAHERILFERLKKGKDELPVQRLLIPEIVELPAAQAGELEDRIEELARFGVEVEPMGGRSFAVKALPVGMEASRARSLLEECAGGAAEDALAARQHRIVATVACHAAVKVNMPLGMEKMAWILRELFRCEDRFQCPHGRATLLRMDEEAIKKSFGRYW